MLTIIKIRILSHFDLPVANELLQLSLQSSDELFLFKFVVVIS